MIHTPLMNLYSIAKPPEPVGWLLMAGTVGLSIAVFRWFETPARHWTRAAILRLMPAHTSAKTVPLPVNGQAR